ncbi:MAG: STAS domain-containing protein [Spirochaetales bacterium]|nr:STAS domain-containing protein [Spirochaetales bacterium]
MEINNNTVTCTCLKNIDLYSERQIRDAILSNLPPEFEDFIFDMTHVSFIDSAGIGMLIYYYNYMTRKGKAFYLTKVQEAILMVLKRNKLDKLLPIV